MVLTGQDPPDDLPDDDEPDDPGDDDPDDDEGDDDDDGEDDYEDDYDILEQLRERVAQESGREWHEISATLESLTLALPVLSLAGHPLGCLVRVISWDFSDKQGTLWLPGVSLEDLHRDPDLEGPT